MNLDRIKKALTRKLGPLPAWAWLGIGAVGLLVWRHFHPGAAAGGGAALPSTPADSGSGFLPADNGTGGGGGGGLPPPDNTPLPSTAPPPPFDTLPPLPPDVLPPDQPWTDQTPLPDNTAPPQDVTTQPTSTKRVAQAVRKIVVSLVSGGRTTKTFSDTVPGSATNVRVLKNGGLTYQTPGGATIEVTPSGGRYRIARGPTVAGVQVPAYATAVRVTGRGAAIYRTPSGSIVEQAPGRTRYVVQRAPAQRRTQSSAQHGSSRSSGAGNRTAPPPVRHTQPAPPPTRGQAQGRTAPPRVAPGSGRSRYL